MGNRAFSWLMKLIGGYGKLNQKNPSVSRFGAVVNGKLVLDNKGMNYLEDYVRQLSLIFSKIKIHTGTEYIYPLDSLMLRMHERPVICSITVDYDRVLQSDLNVLRSRIQRCSNIAFKDRELKVLSAIEKLANRISISLAKSDERREKNLKDYFPKMLYGKPTSLDEALQKLLFYNALFWQMDHYHIGLGRLDSILYEYYQNDILNGIITESEAKRMIRDFILVLGKDTHAKSMSFVGDTGQYILLGGVNEQGLNVDTPLTSLFLEIMAELKIPDPKLILRVNKDTSMQIWNKAVKCILTGTGSPLIMNETLVMDKMVKFGYDKRDVWNVGTSACWEPLIIGKSFDQNNPFKSAIAIKPLNDILLSGEDYTSFNSLLTSYKAAYEKELESIVKDIDFDCSPLFTLFFDDCIDKELDFTNGGAKYSFHGAQVVSLPNTVNALLCIKQFVFDEHLFKLSDCKRAIETNFEGMEDFHSLAINSGKKFGSTDEEVVELTNNLISFTGDVISKLTSNGQPVKVGFSSPNYISSSKDVLASLDGRLKGEPFAVHISPLTSKIDISEVLEFSSMLHYNDNCINGNVVDFIIPSSYIKESEKLTRILKNACSNGIFELQLNVMDKATLVDAKAHPEKYPNLIVRVWGFSAYFNDLPESFKDNLIRRAEVYEAT